MHPQIKETIKTLHVIPSGVAVDLSAPQHTALGRLLYILYYRMPTALLDMVQHGGYPHNGGVHSLVVYGRAMDVVAFIELWKEELENTLWGLCDEQKEVRAQLSYISQEIIGMRSVAKKAGLAI